MNIYGTAVAVVCPIPDSLQDQIAGEGDASMAGQELQQIELFGFDADWFVIETYFAPAAVNDQIAKGENGRLRR